LAGSLRTGEDHEFFLRLLRSGCRGVYEPSAVVRHLVPRDRLTRRYFWRWLFQNGQDVARLERDYTSNVRVLLGVPRYLWRRAIVDVAAGAAAWAQADDPRALHAALSIGWFTGYLREAWFREARS
jgi:hypothetical protein